MDCAADLGKRSANALLKLMRAGKIGIQTANSAMIFRRKTDNDDACFIRHRFASRRNLRIDGL
jgi:hypothetical protein